MSVVTAFRVRPTITARLTAPRKSRRLLGSKFQEIARRCPDAMLGFEILADEVLRHLDDTDRRRHRESAQR